LPIKEGGDTMSHPHTEVVWSGDGAQHATVAIGCDAAAPWSEPARAALLLGVHTPAQIAASLEMTAHAMTQSALTKPMPQSAAMLVVAKNMRRAAFAWRQTIAEVEHA
jgi:hypothetical protein